MTRYDKILSLIDKKGGDGLCGRMGMEKVRKVMLCSPPNIHSENRRRSESLGIRYLASQLEQSLPEVEVTVLDSHAWGISLEATIKEIITLSPDLLGVQIVFHEQISALESIAIAVASQSVTTKIVCGGHVATFSYGSLLETVQNLYCVFCGEGEISFLKYVEEEFFKKNKINVVDKRLNLPGVAFVNEQGEIIKNTNPPLVRNLDSIPFPKRDKRDFINGPHACIISSRGCIGKCSFCSVPAFYKQNSGAVWRLRSSKNIFDEISLLNLKFGVKHFSFLDDLFIGTDVRSKKRATDFARLIIKSDIKIHYAIESRADAISYEIFHKLKESGLSRVFIGIESGSSKSLSIYNKGCSETTNGKAIEIIRQLKIIASLGFILFHPFITINELKTNLEFAKKYNFATPRVVRSHVIPYQGTKLFADLKSKNLLTGDLMCPRFNYIDDDMQIIFDIFQRIFEPFMSTETKIGKAEFKISFKTGDEYNYLFEKLEDIKFKWSDSIISASTFILENNVINSSKEIDIVNFLVCAKKLLHQELDKYFNFNV